jgi:hypothetical protein
MMLSREHYRRLLQLAVVACLIQQLPAQCMDAASDCLAAAIAGECTTNGAYMSVNCKASCGLCGIALGSASKDAAGGEMPLDRIPLMFSGQQIASFFHRKLLFTYTRQATSTNPQESKDLL